VDLYYRTGYQHDRAGLAFLEMVMTCGDEEDNRDYFKFAKALGENNEEPAAAELLWRVMDRELSGSMGEKILGSLVKYAAEADQPDLSERARARLKQLYPESIYLQQEYRSSIQEPEFVEEMVALSSDTVGKERNPLWEFMDEATSEPIFWLVWSIIYSLYYFFGFDAWWYLGDSIWSLLMVYFFPTLVAFGVAYFHLNTGQLVSGRLYGTGRRKSQVEAQRDFNIAHYYDKGALAEKNHEWEEAVKYYRGVLAEDPAHMQARFNLARLYHKQLDRPGSAITEYEALRDNAPEGHVFRREADEAIEAIKSGEVDEGIKPLDFKVEA
jgi:TPR repeat protein